MGPLCVVSKRVGETSQIGAMEMTDLLPPAEWFRGEGFRGRMVQRGKGSEGEWFRGEGFRGRMVQRGKGSEGEWFRGGKGLEGGKV